MTVDAIVSIEVDDGWKTEGVGRFQQIALVRSENGWVAKFLDSSLVSPPIAPTEDDFYIAFEQFIERVGKPY